MTTGYPAILLLDGRLAVVVGGGAVALRKVRTLLDAGAQVHVIAPEVTGAIERMVERGEVKGTLRRFERGDLAGAAVVVAATDDRDVNQGVFEEATERGIPVNVVDDPPRCTFIAPSIVRRGDLVVAISTGGAAPALAVRLRERIERELGPEYEAFLEVCAELRASARLPATEDGRREAWYEVVDSDVLDMVRAGRIEEARSRARAILERER